MKPKSNLGIIVGDKEYIYWKNVVDNLKQEVKGFENALKYSKFCLLNSLAKLKRCPQPKKL